MSAQFPSSPDDQARANTTVAVLAGGASSRMGRPKALLPFGTETLIERVVRLVSELGVETIVAATGDLVLPPLPSARILVDEERFEGPLLAIGNVLRAARAPFCFVCACDQPFPSVALARFLLSRTAGVDVVIPSWKGRRQPLFAAYRRDLAPLFERLVAAGERSLVSALRRVSVREVADEELRAFDPEGLSFLDLDTADDYAAALQRIGDVPEG